MKNLVLTAAFLAGTLDVAMADAPPKPVKFAPGATSTNLKGAVKGYATARYTLEAKNGQAMQMLFKPSNRFCYFTVAKKGASGFVHDGTMDGNEFSRNLPTDESYGIDIFLMRNAARRNETCRYDLSIEITGASGAAR